MEQTVMSEALFAPILLAGLLLLLLALRSGRLGPLLAVGLMLGLGALDRPAAQAVLPLVVGLVVVQPCPWRWWAAAAGLLGLGFLMVVGPWMLRDRAVPQAARMSAGLGDSLFARVHRYDPGFEFRDRAKPSKDPSEARIRNRVFELARVYRYPKEVRAALQAEFGLTDAEGDAALRDAAIQVIRQEPRRYLEGTLDMFIQLGLGFEKPLDEFWETRTKPKNAQEWPEPVRFVMAPVEPPSEAAQALLESLTNLYQDHRAAGLVGVLFLVGTIRSLAGDRRRGWALPSLIVVTQLLIYVALNGPLARYRYPLQPLITLVAAGGLTWPLSRASGREALGKLPIRAWWNNGPLGRRPEESAPAGGPLAYRDTR
jgi:hypothetical protein